MFRAAQLEGVPVASGTDLGELGADPVVESRDDLATGVSGGRPGNGPSLPWAFSSDGRRPLFTSSASDLVATDTNGSQDLFLATPGPGRPAVHPTPGRPG